jgi:phage/plasmid primase-like uncharacterized protein
VRTWVSEFREAIAAAGLTPPIQIIGDGKVHRFSTNDKATDDAGWYVFHDDEFPGGVFGDHRSGAEGKYQFRNGHDKTMSPGAMAGYRQRISERQTARAAEQAHLHAEAAERATALWKRAAMAPADHDYLVRKRIQPHFLRVDADGRLIVSMRDGNELVSLQFIDGDGDKRFLAGGRTAGCYCVFGRTTDTIVIAEGVATAASIYEATGLTTLGAFYSANLLPVATKIRTRFSKAGIVIAADDDYHLATNPGVTKARAAADAVSGAVAVPCFGANRPENATDFNDLMRSGGANVVRDIFETAADDAKRRLGRAKVAAGSPPSTPSAVTPESVTARARAGNGHGGSTTPAGESAADAVTVDDFFAYMPMHQYIFVPTRELWPGSSVNARVDRVDVGGKANKPSDWLDQYRPVDQMAWAPGLPLIVRDQLVSNGGWVDRPGSAVFNQYRPPQIEPGDPNTADRWIEHVKRVYPDAADHIIRWLAQRVQRPHEKINHALVLGGSQGIGKDTILEPVKYAVGPWNFNEVSPINLLGRFNGFVKSVILRVNEARDLGDVDRYAFYDHMKSYTAAPPDVLRCDEKNIREYAVMNVCGVIITSNHKADGIYLPADDRRHFVAWSSLTKEEFDAGYWKGLYDWYAAGGRKHVAAYLAKVDLTDFDAKAPPPKTAAFWDIVDSNRAPEDAELADTLDAMNNPPATTLSEIANSASDAFRQWLQDRKNRRQIPHRLESAGYVAVRNDSAEDGLWKISGRRQAVYARRELSERDRFIAARVLARSP